MEDKKIIYEDDIVVVKYWQEKKIIENKWKKQSILDEESYRKPFLEAINFSKKNDVYYFISDIRQEGIVSHKEKKWFKEYTIPTALEHNIKLAAIITNYNIFKTYYINALIKLGNNMNFRIKMFNKYSKALRWIDSYKNNLNN